VAESDTVEVNYCPCGTPHLISRRVWKQFRAVTENLPPDETVTTPAGSWQVPRVYIAAHGLIAAELPGLAQYYGWAPAGEGSG
jgi:hypothetical protein